MNNTSKLITETNTLQTQWSRLKSIALQWLMGKAKKHSQENFKSDISVSNLQYIELSEELNKGQNAWENSWIAKLLIKA